MQFLAIQSSEILSTTTLTQQLPVSSNPWKQFNCNCHFKDFQKPASAFVKTKLLVAKDRL